MPDWLIKCCSSDVVKLRSTQSHTYVRCAHFKLTVSHTLYIQMDVVPMCRIYDGSSAFTSDNNNTTTQKNTHNLFRFTRTTNVRSVEQCNVHVSNANVRSVGSVNCVKYFNDLLVWNLTLILLLTFAYTRLQRKTCMHAFVWVCSVYITKLVGLVIHW